MSKRSSVEVAIRVRPMRQELNESKISWEITPTTIREKSNADFQFTFERIYNSNVDTATMYAQSVRDNIVKNVALGYNGTVFAYGQTGSGKSYTMLGDGMGGSNAGIVNMSVTDLFTALDAEKKKPGVAISVFVTMLEIYNEQLRDLLSPVGSVALPLAIRENEHGVYVHNATKKLVKNAKECLTLIHNEAESRRVSAATAMNERSSRSHCLIRILVEKSVNVEVDADDDDDEDDENDDEPMQKKILSTLNLVDLAGSERVAKTGATGQRMVEGGHINKSLTILTTVINRLTESGKNGMTHVPYRDSKLTHLLKTAIGGNSFTTVFCCMTAAEQHTDESRSTLQFAARAKTIKNDVSLNEIADAKTKLRELETEIKKYKRYLVAMDIYLMSKKLKIKLLQEAAGTSSGGGGPAGGGNRGGGAMSSSDLAGQVEQMQMIIEQLTVQNDDLMQRLQSGEGAGRGGQHVDPMLGVADDDEKRLLRHAKDALEQELRAALEEKQGLQDNLDELDELLKELEEENGQKVAENQGLAKKVKALEAQLASLQQLEKSQEGQIEKLKTQMKNEETRMLERARGDEMLENLTKLHVEHQNLQIEHNTLIDMFSRAEIDKAAEIDQLNDQILELKEKEEDARVASNIQRMYLWRLLSVAALATHGKPIDPEETTGPVREHQVEAAVKGLTAFVSSRLSRPPGVIGNDGDVEPSSPAKAASVSNASLSNANNAPAGDTPKTPAQPASNASDSDLRKRISELEAQLIAKDAQRDIIIDTKLKRIQDLVLRLHATNGKLVSELHVVATQNNELHEIIKKEPKLLAKLNKTNMQPVSEQDILSKANFAPTPQRPFFHN